VKKKKMRFFIFPSKEKDKERRKTGYFQGGVRPRKKGHIWRKNSRFAPTEKGFAEKKRKTVVANRMEGMEQVNMRKRLKIGCTRRWERTRTKFSGEKRVTGSTAPLEG